MPITLDGTLGITTPSYGGADAAEYLVPVTAFKNRIINGACVIDQRNSGASVTNINGDVFSVDRWLAYGNVASKFTVQQNAGSVTPPAGFTNYIGVTSTSAYSVGAGEYFGVAQYIEGFNTADLDFGKSTAKTITLSFWVRSSLTGTFASSISNGAFNRSYPYTYTINSANTWEYKTITIAGDTTGTWVGATNGLGLRVYFNIGAGSTYAGTAGAWAGSGLLTTSGATSVVGTNGATFYITGVQLEVGTNATFFDARPYGTELALCQRYYQRVRQGFAGRVESSTIISGVMGFPVAMRAAPTQSLLNGTDAWWVPGLSQNTITAILDYNSSTSGFHMATQVSGSPSTGNPAFITLRTNDIFAFSAEL